MTPQRIVIGWEALTPQQRLDGLNWYLRAHRTAQAIATDTKTPLERVCGVIARLSPAIRWEANIAYARELCVTGSVQNYSGWGPNLGRARQVFEFGWTPPPAGPKIAAFRANILFPLCAGAVTLDRHILRWSRHDSQISPKQYHEMAKIWRRAALIAEVLPHQLQAGIWCAVRKGAGG